jgi:hypothetical protein
MNMVICATDLMRRASQIAANAADVLFHFALDVGVDPRTAILGAENYVQ